MSEPTTAATSGYTCSTCGQWVPTGTFHSCGGSPVFSYAPPTQIINPVLVDERIIALLERIAVALEKGRLLPPHDPGKHSLS